jgi:tetratricopeptide (TPR) repeat protein
MFQAWKAGQGDVADSIYSNATPEVIKRMDSHIWEQAVANCLFHSGQFTQASLHYRRAINDKLDCDLCWFNLGNCHLELNGLFEAVDCYREALALWEEFNPALLNLGIAYLRLSMEEDAKDRWSATSHMCATRAVRAFQSVKLPTLKLSAQFNEFETTVRYGLKRWGTWQELKEVYELYSYLSNHVGVNRMNSAFDLTEYKRELLWERSNHSRLRRPILVTPRRH